MKPQEIICYNGDASRLIGKPEKVFTPKTKEEAQRIIQSTTLDIIPRGAGTNLVGGCTPDNSAVIDLSKMNKILEFDSSKGEVNVEAGITIKELNEKLKARKLEFPISLNNNGISTIGGMIATNASGNNSLKYGTMKEWINQLEFINGRGELVKLRKSELGDVCGLEGITGVIVSAKLKIIPLLTKSISVFQSDSLDEILSITRRLKLEKEIIRLQLFPPKISALLNFPEKYNLIIEFASERGKIKGQEYLKLSNTINNIYYLFASKGYYDSEDPKFFFDKLKEFILFLEEMQIPYFGYLGSGIIHPFFKDREEEKKIEVRNFIKKTRTKPSKYGIGITRKNILEPSEKKIIQRIKQRHDPFGKFNKNKVIDFNVLVKQSEPKPITPKPIQETKKTESIDSANNQFSNSKEFEIPSTKEVEIPLKPKEGIDYNQIQNIMTNKLKTLEPPPQESQIPHKPLESQADKDLINSIMTNKLKKQEPPKETESSDSANEESLNSKRV